ncbi:MAG: hypothetical protein RL427_1356 [Bacteroidota bacterium]|jgi:hypothetical protein
MMSDVIWRKVRRHLRSASCNYNYYQNVFMKTKRRKNDFKCVSKMGYSF